MNGTVEEHEETTAVNNSHELPVGEETTNKSSKISPSKKNSAVKAKGKAGWPKGVKRGSPRPRLEKRNGRGRPAKVSCISVMFVNAYNMFISYCI